MTDWALILGVSGVAGGAIAKAVAVEPGLNVAGFHRGRWPEQAAEVDAAVRASGRKAAFIEAEAGTAEGADEGAKALFEKIGPGRVKLVVHAIANASLGHLTGPEALVPRQVEKTFESMAHSFLYWTQALLRHEMLAPSACILGLTNPMAETLLRNAPLIAATKAALEIYVKHLAWELGPQGHRVNLLKYGGVLTPAVERTFDEHVQRLEQITERISPVGRMVRIEEVAQFVSVLASERGKWFNGAVIDYTGGEFQSLYDALIHPAR